MAHAILRGFRESPRRVRMVAEMVRGKPVDQALSILRFQTRKAARMLIKVINSAVANAAENEKVDVDRLILRKIDVDGGPV